MINTFYDDDSGILERIQEENNCVILMFDNYKSSSSPSMSIFGPSNEAIIETAIFFVNLKCAEVTEESVLSIYNRGHLHPI